MNVNDLDYYLPEELIAQNPAEKRDQSRLMVVHRSTGEIEHKHFFDILDYLHEGDCLVMNNSKVIPARLFGFKEGTGAKVEFLLSKRIEGDKWETLVKPGKKVHIGDTVLFGIKKDGEGYSFSDAAEDTIIKAHVVGYGDEGTRIVEFEYDGIFMEKLEKLGRIPLPPYIDREDTKEDRERYQTVYAKFDGSVAAPTAGLHFTEEILEKAKAKGVKLAYVTLHVGIGTFRPVKVDKVEEHHMHFEEYFIDEENAQIINETKAAGGRVISVGTTSTRTLESAADRKGHIVPGHGNTNIFIYPGYEFKMIDALITNFHLPKSTLLMLISALYNREDILRVYNMAVKEKYRFFSYGDACFFE